MKKEIPLNLIAKRLVLQYPNARVQQFICVYA